MTGSTSTPATVTLHVPFRIVKAGGWKEMQSPERANRSRRADSTQRQEVTPARVMKRSRCSGANSGF